MDVQSAMALAETALARMTAIALITFENHRSLSIRGICTRDTSTGKVMTTVILGQFGIQGRSRVGFAGLVTNGEGAGVRDEPTFCEAILQLADNNDHLMRALHLYGSLQQNWRELYMVLETVEEGNGGEQGLIDKGWAPNENIKNFKATATSYKALGSLATFRRKIGNSDLGGRSSRAF